MSRYVEIRVMVQAVGTSYFVSFQVDLFDELQPSYR